jgi:hypothetical protein
MPATHRRLTAVLFSTSLLALAPATALAQMEGVKETSKSTYTLVPERDAVQAHSVIKLVNQRKPTKSRGPCKGAPRRTCTTTTRYYIAGWSVILALPGADDVAVTGKGIKPQLLATTSWGSGYSVSFPKLFHKKKQTIDLRYELPDGGPASDVRTRVTDAYARFCWSGQYTDTGTVRAVLPAGWEAVTAGGATTTSAGGDGTVVTATRKKSPGSSVLCTDAFLAEALDRSRSPAPGGQVITYHAWPDDPAWTGAISDIVDEYLPVLETTFGSPMPFAELTIQEAARINNFGQPSDLDPSIPRLMLDEDVDFAGAPVAALARTWFADGSIADPWLAEGLALWAGLTATGSACPDPGPYPLEGAPSLLEWQVRDVPHYVDPALPAWQAMAACSIVQEVADLVGPERMSRVVASLLEGTPRYDPQAAPTVRGGADWTDWLDAADELGLVPAGITDLEVAERTLQAMGIAEPGRLAGRATARQTYHQALEAMDGVGLPRFVTQLMESWSFDEAVPAILASRRVYDRIMADTTMAEDTRDAFMEVLQRADSIDALASLEQAAAPGT